MQRQRFRSPGHTCQNLLPGADLIAAESCFKLGHQNRVSSCEVELAEFLTWICNVRPICEHFRSHRIEITCCRLACFSCVPDLNCI